MKYAVIENGVILRIVDCEPSEASGQGDLVVEISADILDDTHYYKDGVFKTYPTRIHETSTFDMETEQWVDTRTVQEQIAYVLRDIRYKRSIFLATSDWTQANDTPLTDEQKVAWATYRQSLRDMPEVYANETDINNVVWPERP